MKVMKMNRCRYKEKHISFQANTLDHITDGNKMYLITNTQ